jgi:branched-subunit amino acid aminotransferase/4-amino-4-deoxychorismate lyase
MSQFVIFNKQLCAAEDAFLPAVSSAVFYSRGVFTTVAIYNSEPFQWKKHWARLIKNSEKLKLDLSEFSEESVKQNLVQVIGKNKLKSGRARLTFFDESPNKLWQTTLKRATSFLITTGELRSVSDNLSLMISDFQVNSTSPLAGVKSCNYLENILSLEDAKNKGFDEAVRLNVNGEIVSVSMANIFWVKGGELFTPSLKTGCLSGTTRSFVLENFSVKETEANLATLRDADEIFLTSTGIGIANVKSFDKKNFAGEITNYINEKFLRRCYLDLSINNTSL